MDSVNIYLNVFLFYEEEKFAINVKIAKIIVNFTPLI